MRFVLYLLPVAALAGGCLSDDGSDNAPTYYADVAPIFARDCGSCHQPGGIGPFDISDYETSRQWAPLIAASVKNRTMPPYLVTDDGSCGEYAGSGWLSAEEIDSIQRWAAADAPAGDPVVGPDFSGSSASLGQVDIQVEVPGFLPQVSDTPGSEFDEYRCFAVTNDSDTDQYITAFEGVPEQVSIVHHITAYSVDMAAESYLAGVSNGELVGNLQATADDRPGWPCYGAAGDGVKHSGIPAVWAPGQGVVHYPDGVGYRLRPSEDVVLQVHYNFPNPQQLAPDHSAVAFQTAETVERIAWFTAPDDFLQSYILYSYGIIDEHASLPAGEQAASFGFDYPASSALLDGGFDPNAAPAFELLGVMPHMHELGRKQWLRLEPDNANSCAMEVKNWDFDWQRFYFFEAGIPLTADSQMRIDCEWDTRSRQQSVAPGWGTDAEMCLLTMMFAVPLASAQP